MSAPSNICDIASSDSLDREYWNLQDKEITHGYVAAAFLILFECLGLPWNCLVIITIFKEKLYNQPTIILLLNLTLTDLFLLVCPMPLIITTASAGEFLLGSSDSVRCMTCKINIFAFSPILISILTVALMSLDRFIYIYAPFKYERSSTKYVVLISVVAVIVVSIGLGLAVRFGPGNSFFFPAFFFCITMYSEPTNVIPLLIVVTIIATVIFMTAINCSFCYIVMKNIRAVYSHNDFEDETTHQSKLNELKKRVKLTRNKKQRRLCLMVSALTLTSLVTVLPWVGLTTFVASYSFSDTVPTLATIFLIMDYSQVVVHPVLQTCLVPDIQKPMKRLITCGYYKQREEGEYSEKKYKCHQCFTKCLQLCRGEKSSFMVTAIKAAISPHGSGADDTIPEIHSSTEL